MAACAHRADAPAELAEASADAAADASASFDVFGLGGSDSLPQDTVVDLGAVSDTVERVDASACLARKETCISGDLNPSFARTAALESLVDGCKPDSPAFCESLDIVFDSDGCAVALTNARNMPTEFVSCLAATLATQRWRCGQNRTIPVWVGGCGAAK